MRLLGPLAVVAVAVALAWPTLDVDFLGDDFGYIGLYHAESLLSSMRLEDLSRGIWGYPLDELRPGAAFAIKASTLLAGASARGHHVLNIVLNVAVVLVVYFLALTVTRRVGTAALAGLLFAAAPVHAEPIAWITGKAEPVPTLLFLWGFFAYVVYRRDGLRRHYALSLFAFTIGIFTREILVMLPPLLVLWDVQSASRHAGPARWRESIVGAVRRSLPFVFIAAAFFRVRWLSYGNFVREGRLGQGAIATFVGRQPDNFRALLLPAGPAVTWLLLALLLMWLVVLIQRRASDPVATAFVFYFGPLWYSLSILPLIVTYPSFRHLYLPSCGVSIALAVLILPAARGHAGERLLRLASAAVLVAASARALLSREQEWIHAGSVSRTVRSDITRLAGSLPAGSTVVLSGIPSDLGDAFVWQWALPYALQPPFTSANVYARLRILEPPGIYCCQPRKWWQERKAVVAALVVGPADETVAIYGLHWNPHRRAIVLKRGRLTRGELRALSERALRQPFEDLVEPEEPALRRLVGALAAAARQSPGDP